MTGQERVRALLEAKPVDHLPLMPMTMMFAALYSGQKYIDYERDFEHQAEAQTRTADAFGFDHVSAISGSAEALDCGARVRYFEEQPFAIDEQQVRLAKKADLATLKKPLPAGGPRMQNRLTAVSLLHARAGREKLVEGWIEGPCAAAADLRGINTVMLDFFDDPEFVVDLFQFVLDVATQFGKAQIEAGAGLIGVGNAAASLIGPAIYLPGHTRNAWWMRCTLPVGKFACTFAEIRAAFWATSPCWTVTSSTSISAVPMSSVRERIGTKAALLGNLDPVRVLRDGTPESVAAAIEECHHQAGSRHIVAAGCEVPRDTPAENLRAMRDFAASHSLATNSAEHP